MLVRGGNEMATLGIAIAFLYTGCCMCVMVILFVSEVREGHVGECTCVNVAC